MNHCIEFIKTAIDKQLVQVVSAFHPMTAGKWKWMNGWSFVLCCYDSPTFFYLMKLLILKNTGFVRSKNK